MNFFDYVYYRSYSLYKNILGDSTPMLYALCVVSLMQQFNVFTMLYFAYVYLDLNMNINKYVLYASFLVFIIPNYLRYSKFSYEQMDEKWRNVSKNKKIRGTIFMVLYIILSTIAIITTAIILGKVKRGRFKVLKEVLLPAVP
ncbi:hypothetical protein CJ739_1753 [Mariniflexile rhizosphaerae]|uniref:hypothetical protein n=1 Tax=unclassified Mariniflexile TaxID=2643887 RepID=UPI000E332446|nr:hypothetical protein [Mariniflexile sp. TRM1-10]AXP80839.1 hypothetical protein CJ739_1753 [Mariniflexile sp. TRM1-10]